jgi:hypothetical protein
MSLPNHVLPSAVSATTDRGARIAAKATARHSAEAAESGAPAPDLFKAKAKADSHRAKKAHAVNPRLNARCSRALRSSHNRVNPQHNSPRSVPVIRNKRHKLFARRTVSNYHRPSAREMRTAWSPDANSHSNNNASNSSFSSDSFNNNASNNNPSFAVSQIAQPATPANWIAIATT